MPDVSHRDDVSEITVAGLFPPSVAVGIKTGAEDEEPLFPEERRAILNAVVKRQREFASGRAAARQALRALGFPDAPIPALPDRSPWWPHGAVGSITHCEGLCLSVAARHENVSGLGIDAEQRLKLEAGVSRLVCTPREVEAMLSLPPALLDHWPTVLFSGKEAFYKCYRPLFSEFLDFQDVSMIIYPSFLPLHGEFSIIFERRNAVGIDHADWFTGRYFLTSAYVVCGVTANSDRHDRPAYAIPSSARAV